MFSFFGGKPKGTGSGSGGRAPSNSHTSSSHGAADASLIKMRDTLEIMEKKEAHLETKINAELALAKQYVTTKPESAKMALKRKKMYEEQRESMRGARFNLERQILTIENATINLETIEAMKHGSSAMRSIHGSLNVDMVDATMDDIREQMDLAGEVSAAISNPISMGGSLDAEEDLEAELAALESTAADEEMLGAIPGMPLPRHAVSASPQTATAATPTSGFSFPTIPDIPTAAASEKAGQYSASSAPSAQDDEDRELAALKASMNLA